MLPIQLDAVSCACCASIVAADCNINLFEVSVTKDNCRLCALFFSTAERHCRDNELNVQIIRERSALKIGIEGPRILRLCSDSECSADTGQDIQISYPVLPKPESPARFALLRAWLRWCNKSHNCKKHDAESKATLPTRLLYIADPDPGVLRFYCPKKKDSMKYIALSHCWGLKHGEKPNFFTTAKNIKIRPKQFSSSELPNTFRDAVQVTRELGIQYLWIDSLCIIQSGDNGEDWKRECQHMEDVYASAYCTIAATSAVDSNAGFLERNVSREPVYVQEASGRRFYVCTDINNFNNDVKQAPLNKRA